MKAYEVSVRGKVQRVGYRRYLLDIAQELGISGYVENMPDGSVHIFVQGPQEKLNGFIGEAKNLMYPANVSEIIIKEVEPNPEQKYFEIKYGGVVEELQEGFGAIQRIFMEYWRGFRDYREEFRDFANRTDENFKILMDKYGEISRKLTEMMESLIEESKKTSQVLEGLGKESKETCEILNRNLELLRQAVEKLGQKR